MKNFFDGLWLTLAVLYAITAGWFMALYVWAWVKGGLMVWYMDHGALIGWYLNGESWARLVVLAIT